MVFGTYKLTNYTIINTILSIVIQVICIMSVYVKKEYKNQLSKVESYLLIINFN